MELIYTLKYHSLVKEDIKKINQTIKKRIKLNIELKLTTHPELYGVPLRKSLKGYRKLRVGDYRVVFKITAKNIYILAIMHRSIIYDRISTRK